MEGFKVKEMMRWLLCTLILCMFPTLSHAIVEHAVKKTVHNLGSTSKSSVSTTETSEVCIFCHTPHNAAAGKKFLWNRLTDANSALTFMFYTSSPTLNISNASKAALVLSDISKMCMTCHDGVTAFNSMANPKNPFPGFGATMGDYWPQGAEYGPNIGGGELFFSTGDDLTNDHPISFEYQEAQSADPLLKTRTAGRVGDLPLWDRGDGKYRLECVTCHDPHVNYGWPLGRNDTGCHDATVGGDCKLKPFLRKSNASSSLCYTCHDK